MYFFEGKNSVVIPVDFNVFFQSACDYKKNIRYSREYTLSEAVFNKLQVYLQNKKENKFIAIDMNHIVSYPARIFNKLNIHENKVFFYGVNNPNLRQRMKEDLEDLIWLKDDVACFENSYSNQVEKIIESECKTSRQEHQNRIIGKLVEDVPHKVQLLESSGLYSNFYVNIKQLFIDVKGYYYIIFCLAEKISYLNEKVDAFISSSKNGAIIANVLGGILDIKEVHLIGVGPKYSMELGDSVDCIKAGKKYMYIFDFMCTGTELKIVSALVNSKKASLRYAVGVAKYRKAKIESQLFKNVIVLADTEELKIDYKIAGEEKDIITLREKINE